MAQKAFTMVFYIVPEDQDDIEQPNAFGIHKNQEDIKPNDIADSFPLPGEYIFRYRYKFQNSIVWMDINAGSNKIPLFNGKIYIKATRVSWTKNNAQQPLQTQSNANPQTQVPRQPSNQGYQQVSTPVSAQQKVVQQPQQVRTPVNQGYQTMEQPSSGNSKFASQGTNGSQNKSTNLLDDYEEKPSQKKKPQTNQFEADLLDMDDLGAGSSSNNSQQQNKHDDLWNF